MCGIEPDRFQRLILNGVALNRIGDPMPEVPLDEEWYQTGISAGTCTKTRAWKCHNRSRFKLLGNWGRPKESSPLGHPQPHAAPGSTIQILRGAQ